MAHDPSAIQRYLHGAAFPASGSELAGVAAGNGAREDLVSRLRAFRRQYFSDAPAVSKALTQHPAERSARQRLA